MSTNLPSVPTIPSGLDPQLAQVLSALKSNVDTIQSGVSQGSFVTQDQLTSAISNVATTLSISNAYDYEPPIALDNLVVTAGILFNLLVWGQLPPNMDHVNIYRAATDDRTVAMIVGTTQYCIYGDYIPAGVNTKYYYWLRAVSKQGVEGSWNLINGLVSTAGTSATPLGINDKQVDTISASKIYALSLAALSANLGTVTAGKMQSGDNMFIVNLTDKYIRIGSGSANPGKVNPWYGDHYIDIYSGAVTNYEWNGSRYVDSKSLRVIEVGTAQNNSTVVLNKYYKTQPQIIVSPDSIQSYSAAYASVDQTLQIGPVDIRETVPGSGSWQFRVLAQLALANGYVTQAPNWSSGPQTANTIQSGVYTTPANTVAISVSVGLTSIRGTGTAPNYCYRNVSYSLYARPSGIGGYVLLGYTTVPIGATLSQVGSNLTGNTGSPNSWDFYVVATFSDAGGTFTSGSGGYEYAPDVVVKLAADTGITTVTSGNSTTVTGYASWSFPAFTPTPGYSVYNVNYNATFGYYLTAATTSGGTGTATISNPSGAISVYANGSYKTDTKGTSGIPAIQSSYGYSSASYSTTGTGINLSATGTSGDYIGQGSANASASVRFFASGTQATIQQRRVIGNSGTPSNTLVFGTYASTIAGATTIAGGTLKYTAIL